MTQKSLHISFTDEENAQGLLARPASYKLSRSIMILTNSCDDRITIFSLGLKTRGADPVLTVILFKKSCPFLNSDSLVLKNGPRLLGYSVLNS